MSRRQLYGIDGCGKRRVQQAGGGYYDPELWLEDDLPLLRAIKLEYEEGQARESGVLPVQQPNTMGDDKGIVADPTPD